MDKKIKKQVLIVDDECRMAEALKDRFTDCNSNAECPYEFDVDVANSAAECVERIRNKDYDLTVLDVLMEEEDSGLRINFEILYELRWEVPIRIVFTGFPKYRDCVEAMRSRAWDYIVKEDVGNTSMFQIVVDSAIARLRQLDLRRTQESQIAGAWLAQHDFELRERYAGQLVALWHDPEVRVIAFGRDAFELEERLRDWRQQHLPWQQPFILEVSAK